ncbi:hypothetical protein HC024_03260 [Methylococcaceae bacterium WWC4]|nr:hypothetical protein [Methylococcaceae bacterium WWC4]
MLEPLPDALYSDNGTKSKVDVAAPTGAPKAKQATISAEFMGLMLFIMFMIGSF